MKKIAFLILSFALLLTSCGGNDAGEKASSAVETQSIAEESSQIVSEEASEEVSSELSIIEVEDENPPVKDAGIDGNTEKAFEYLKNENLLVYSDVAADKTVTRLEFAANIAYYSGFLLNFDYYYCHNDYSDFAEFSDEMKYAEIAVNQGFMVKPEGDAFGKDENVTYSDVIRGFLYVLGYREYADVNGYIPLAKTIGLNQHIEDKTLEDGVTYGEFAQIAYNAFHLPIVQCVEKDGEYRVVKRDGGFYIRETYIDTALAKEFDGTMGKIEEFEFNKDESNSIFRLANKGWRIFNGEGYKYGPSVMLNEDGSIYLWAASHTGIPNEVDWGALRKSYDGGKSWTIDTPTLQPTFGTEDWNWTCDPGVVKFGDYYYIAYTSTTWHDGLDNGLFVARSKKAEGPFIEKWDGKKWSYDTDALVAYDGTKDNWGAGEGTFTVVDGKVYLYSTWDSGDGCFQYVYSAPADDENWPAKLEFEGVAFKRAYMEDSGDVKFVDAYNSFIAVAAARRFSENCYIHTWVSYDGIYFRHESAIRHQTEGSNLLTCIHNMGLASTPDGHIDIFAQNYVSYAHQPEGYGWGAWPTQFVPISWVGSSLYNREETAPYRKIDSFLDLEHSEDYVALRVVSSGNSRLIEASGIGSKTGYKIQKMTKRGDWVDVDASGYAKIKFTYDESKLSIEPKIRKVSLLTKEVALATAELDGLECYFMVRVKFDYDPTPVKFYPETDTIRFVLKGETKQPGFIARSSSGDYLIMWGELSSYKEESGGKIDAAPSVSKWDRFCTLLGWDENIISVDTSNGKITAISSGTTKITATYMGMTAEITVVVDVV